MRRILLLLTILLLACPSWAADKTQSVTVAQLGQLLAAVHAQPDAQIAKALDNLTLTERASSAQLAQWESTLPGRHSRDALTALADASVLMPLPQADILPDPPPGIDAQRAMLSLANNYVTQSLARLPDFNATRTTVSFADIPGLANTTIPHGDMESSCDLANHAMVGTRILLSSNCMQRPVVMAQAEIVAQPLHRTGQSTTRVSYRNGMEVRGGQVMDGAADDAPALGMRTAGEFGPILACVLGDAGHGTVKWGYWQQGPQGKIAVFRYAVPQSESNYVVSFGDGTDMRKFSPAYHGEIALDPATGAILHISVVADTVSLDMRVSAIVVDYGPVQLGGRDYICPLKGIAVLQSFERMRSNVKSIHGGLLDTENSTGLQTQINDTTFTGYHLLRGDVTILPAQQ